MSGYNNPNLNNYGKPTGPAQPAPQVPRPAQPAPPPPPVGVRPYQGPVPQGLPPGVVPPGTYVPGSPQDPNYGKPMAAPANYAPPMRGAPPPPPPGYPGMQPGMPYPYPVPYRRTGPNPGLGILKLLFGLGLLVFGIAVVITNGHKGYGMSGFGGVMLGCGAALCVTGGMNVARKKLGVKSLAIVALFAIAGTFAGPPVSAAYFEAHEKTLFDQCVAYDNDFSWQWEYFDDHDLPYQFRREEAYGEFMKCAARKASKNKNVTELRAVIKMANWLNGKRDGNQAITVFKYENRFMQNAKASPVFDEAKKLCTDTLDAIYAEALAKLAKPAEAAADAEFKPDEKLRAAFATLLKDLSTSEDSTVYVKFSNKVDLKAPEGNAEVLKKYQESDKALKKYPKGDAPVIAQGEAFSPKFDTRRRDAAMAAMRDAFSKVFSSELLTLTSLPPGTDGKGKPVLELDSAIFRRNSFYTYTSGSGLNEQFIGILFSIFVDWRFALSDASGKLLYEEKTRSIAGSKIDIDTKPNDPDWAPYSIMMDSAYYNFSREVTGKFGLQPPPERTSFAYEGAK